MLNKSNSVSISVSYTFSTRQFAERTKCDNLWLLLVHRLCYQTTVFLQNGVAVELLSNSALHALSLLNIFLVLFLCYFVAKDAATEAAIRAATESDKKDS